MGSADFLWLALFRTMVLYLFESVEDSSSTRPHGVSHIPFSLLSQVPDLLFWFYVYLLGFDLYGNLTHHLALYQVSVRNLERIATPLPSPKASRLTACGSLRLAVTTYDWTFTS